MDGVMTASVAAPSREPVADIPTPKYVAFGASHV